ncbi:MAG: hypothetical protein O2983_03465 [Planctomycetota bacterium]|nr:hypothetical protein [Planctomycetota bacterium]MDA0919159.1 hypothetical protein [Planctomycetota bacterium]MDA1158645.1 hypothetical protein [Planctomycetota bacterium]
MNRLLASSVVLAIAAASAVSFAADGVKSGLQPNEKAGFFLVKDVTGPNKDKSLCYRCKFGGRPVAAIFTREINDDLAGLVKKLDEAVKKNEDKQLKSFVVFLTNDPDKDEKKLEELARKHELKSVPLTMFDGETGPETYKISKDAETTVLLWKGLTVQSNHAYAKGKFDKKDTEVVLKDLNKIIQ